MSSPQLDLAEKVIQLLGSDSAITNVMAQRFYRIRVPQTTTAPYIVVAAISERRISHLRGVTPLERVVTRFHLFGTNYLQLKSVRSAIIDLLFNSGLASGDPMMEELYEDDTKVYHLVLDLSLWNRIGS